MSLSLIYSSSRLVWLALMLASSISAQVSKPGKYSPIAFTKSKNFTDVIFTTPELDNKMLMEEAKAAERPNPLTHQRPPGPLKFAQGIDLAIDMQIPAHGTWIEDNQAQRKIWRTIIKAPGAVSMSLLFNDFHLPANSELYIIGQEEILGAFTPEINNKETRKFATAPVAGDIVIVEYHEPMVERSEDEQPPALKIMRILRGFRATPFGYGQSGNCHIDVACKATQQTTDAANATALIITNEGTSFCTGTMINNVREDGKQYLLTAAHCLFADPSYFVVGFNYQNDYCGQGLKSQSADLMLRPQTVHGVKLLSKWDKSDFALLEVMEKIPDEYNVFMAGWDANIRNFLNGYSIHHPHGDAKKISLFNGTPILSSTITGDPSKLYWKVSKWEEGATEHGSSGAGLFNTEGFLVGHLWGGSSNCETLHGFDKFGALFADFQLAPARLRLNSFLDPDELDIKIMKGAYLKDLNRSQPDTLVTAEYSIKKLKEIQDWLLNNPPSLTNGYIFNPPSSRKSSATKEARPSTSNPQPQSHWRPVPVHQPRYNPLSDRSPSLSSANESSQQRHSSSSPSTTSGQQSMLEAIIMAMNMNRAAALNDES